MAEVSWTRRECFSLRGEGEMIGTADSLEALEAGIKEALSGIDRHQSPSVQGPFPTEDGKWTATVQWWGLGD